MNFNFGNLVGAAVGAVVRVAVAIVSAIAQAVLGALAAVAEAREDGELSDEQAEELFEEKFKALLGAYMLSLGSGSSNSESQSDVLDLPKMQVTDGAAVTYDKNGAPSEQKSVWDCFLGMKDYIYKSSKSGLYAVNAGVGDFSTWSKKGINDFGEFLGLDYDRHINGSDKTLRELNEEEYQRDIKGDDELREKSPDKELFDDIRKGTKYSLIAADYALAAHSVAQVGKAGFGIVKGKFGKIYVENKEFAMDPVNAVTGSLYIPATDMVLPDIHEEFRIERKYESINNRVGLLGLGWTNNFETYLSIVDEKADVLCNDGHIETFYQIEDEWVNDKGEAKIYSLSREKDCWIFKSNKDKKTYKYDNLGKLIDITDKYNNKLSLTYVGENIETLTTFSNYKLFFTYKDGKVIEIKDELGRTSSLASKL